MALQIDTQVNGVGHASPAEEDELFAQLLRLEDAVLSGRHPLFRLPPAAVDKLKSLLIASSVRSAFTPSTVKGAAFSANAAAAATDHAQQSATPATPSFTPLPGLQTRPPTLKPTSSGGLDPIFLEKSDSLVRAEGQLKRLRIERELQAQVEQRKHARDKEQGIDAPSAIDVEAIIAQSGLRENHVSGLKVPKAATPASSFDENDYYSSQVESDWSSPHSASKASDRAAGALAADREAVNGAYAPAAKSSASGKQPIREPAYRADIDMYDVENDDDDEYAPPDAVAFDTFARQNAAVAPTEMLPADEDSDYEPGEITQESNVATPYHQTLQPSQPSPRVPVIRNHLTHIAQPQPNRVSPLAVAKRPSIELELINGRPEVVTQKPPAHPRYPLRSRASTASPPNGGPGGKKRRQKKRKREAEATTRNKRKRDKHNGAQSPGVAHQEPRIKDEPMSPPSFVSIPEVPQYVQRQNQQGFMEIDLVSPRFVPPPAGYTQEPPRSATRYEYAQPGSPAVVRVASPAHYRPVPRDTQDLRRVASLHHAQRAPSPPPQRTVSVAYGDPRLSRASVAPVEAEPLRYSERPAEEVRYRRQRSRSPPRLQEYRDPYARAASPAMMPPPAATPRRIVVDQHGNRYYAADPAPAPTPIRASVAPVDRQPYELSYERAPSRMATSYAPAAPHYEAAENRMAPPTVPPRRQVAEDIPVQYIDASGYRTREYSTRPAEQSFRYVEAPTSPVYQAPARYDHMPPPAPPIREPTSPVYAPPRSYSVRPEEPMPLTPAYAARQASVTPAQYVREAPPQQVRASSVMPGYEPARAYSQAPQNVQVRYVDQYGREVYPEIRQVPAPEYQY